MARRPGVPVHRRIRRWLPPLRRLATAVGALAVAAALVWLVEGPWLRVDAVTWAGERHTPEADLAAALAGQEGASLLAVDTAALAARLEQLPSVAEARVTASLLGSVSATIVEPEAAFVWRTSRHQYLGTSDGVLFAARPGDVELPPALGGLPAFRDERFAARVVSVGDRIPAGLLRTAMRLAEIDPAALGSDASALTIRLDDEYGFRLVATDPGWEAAFGVYGLDPRESAATAVARLERQVTAVRTLFATQPESEISWVDVRNPGKVYFRDKG